LRYDLKAGEKRPTTAAELDKYHQLAQAVENGQAGARVQVTGTLHKQAGGQYVIDVRDFAML
jgi:hypothetical protein